MPSLVVIGKQIKEKQRNRVKDSCWCFFDASVFTEGLKAQQFHFLFTPCWHRIY